MAHHDKCPLCSSSAFSSFLRCRDNLVTNEEFELIECQHCGFVCTQDHPDEENIGKYYQSDDYISHNDSAKGFSNRIYLSVRNIMLGRKRKIVERAAGMKGGNLLDIGCGTGYFAGEMKKAGWSVKGIEPNERARIFGVEKFGIEILVPDKIQTLTDGSFDCITMWHVLEHFQDPFSYAKEVRRLLRPGEMCFCALPNCSSFDAEYYKENWAAYDVPRHLWHFTPETFCVFAGKSGFKVTGIRPLPLDVFYISILSEKNRGTRYSFPAGMIKGFWFWFRSLFNTNKSSSLIYFLGKK
jgi:SAM-dependent methyltransferase